MRSGLFWVEDESIILDSGSRGNLHKTTLSRESTVFSDMFKLSPPADEPMVDGCHVVRLSDAAQDVEIFLQALYDHR